MAYELILIDFVCMNADFLDLKYFVGYTLSITFTNCENLQASGGIYKR
jgi:hypothetical protein